MKKTVLFSLAITSCISLITAGCGGGDDSFSLVNAPTPVPGATAPAPTAGATATPEGRAWTVAEILAEPARGGRGGEPSCGGEFGFRRCICAEAVPSYVRYRPAVVECNGNAAAILSGPLLNAFSAVIRDTQNRDRFPDAGSGYGGCSFEEADSESPPARCSAFKAQSRFKVGNDSAEIYCFGESGYSDIFSDASRITVKISDNPFSSDDDIERYCLSSPTLPLN